MAVYYVSSAAAGTNAGTSKTDAFTAFGSAVTAATAADDEINVSHTHDENFTSSQTWQNGNLVDTTLPVRIVSRNWADDSPTQGALLRTATASASLAFRGRFHVYGMISRVTNGTANAGVFASAAMLFENCAIQLNVGNIFKGSSASFGAAMRFVRGSIDVAFTGSNRTVAPFAPGSSGDPYIFEDVTISATGGVAANCPAFTNVTSLGLVTLVRATGIDLSLFDYVTDENFTDTTGQGVSSIRAYLERCRLKSGWLPQKNTATDRVRNYGSELVLSSCGVGVLTAAPLVDGAWKWPGHVKTVTTPYRNSGAARDSVSYSMEMVAYASRTKKGTETLAAQLTLFSDRAFALSPGGRTVSIHIAHNAVGAGTAGRLTSGECWARLRGPGVSGNADAPGYLTRSVTPVPDAAGTDLADDNAAVSWTGSNVGTMQVITFTFTNTWRGGTWIDLFFAPGGASDKTINVCPKVSLL